MMEQGEEEPVCPACIATMALTVAGATSAGGLTALIMKKIGVNGTAKENPPQTQIKGKSS